MTYASIAVVSLQLIDQLCCHYYAYIHVRVTTWSGRGDRGWPDLAFKRLSAMLRSSESASNLFYGESARDHLLCLKVARSDLLCCIATLPQFRRSESKLLQLFCLKPCVTQLSSLEPSVSELL